MTQTSQSTLIELPPESQSSQDFAADQYPEFSSPEELSDAIDGLNSSLLDRALYKGDLFANYYIRGFIAAGGMGEIYVAQRLNKKQQKSRPLALKVLSNEQAQRRDVLSQLEREAKLCQAVHSRHVVRIYEYGLSETQRAFVSMELLLGEELYDRMTRLKVFHIKELATLAIEILDGLHDIHQMGIVHRDLKPENIYLAKSRRWGEIAKILDFGLAKRDGEPDPLAQSKELVGTPNYIAPEQIKSPNVDHRADIYSLGVILYQCAVGDAPFERETPYATMLAHQEDPVPSLPSTLDYQFCEIIQKAMAKRPEDRWQSAMEMRMTLDEWVTNTSWDEGIPGMDSFNPADIFKHEDSAPHFPQTPVTGSPVLQRPRTPHLEMTPEFNVQRGLFEEQGSPPANAPQVPLRQTPPRAQIVTLQGEHAPPSKAPQDAPPELDVLAKAPAPKPHKIQPLPRTAPEQNDGVRRILIGILTVLILCSIGLAIYYGIAKF